MKSWRLVPDPSGELLSSAKVAELLGLGEKKIRRCAGWSFDHQDPQLGSLRRLRDDSKGHQDLELLDTEGGLPGYIGRAGHPDLGRLGAGGLPGYIGIVNTSKPGPSRPHNGEGWQFRRLILQLESESASVSPRRRRARLAATSRLEHGGAGVRLRA